jgi:hypothetical protein
MKKIKWEINIDWKSKLIDLLIVIIGITIAFQLEDINEFKKSKAQEKDYLKSFYKENQDNETHLTQTLEYAIKIKKILIP